MCFVWRSRPFVADDHFHDRHHDDDDYCYLQKCHQKRVVEWNNMKVLYLAITCDIHRFFFDDQLHSKYWIYTTQCTAIYMYKQIEKKRIKSIERVHSSDSMDSVNESTLIHEDHADISFSFVGLLGHQVFVHSIFRITAKQVTLMKQMKRLREIDR